MTSHRLFLALLGVVAFTLASWIEPWFQNWAGSRAGAPNLLATALGDGRHLFARQIYAKADAYFHNGYYPTIYDSQEGFEKSHVAGPTGAHGDFLGPPRDWIDRFSRHFFPSRHTHLGESPSAAKACDQCAHGAAGHEHDETCSHDHGDHAGHANEDCHDPDCDHAHRSGDVKETAGGKEREILPWLRLSVELDPHRIETYTVGAYWLRQAMKRSAEAEQFLREGLRHNPANPELLFELGKLYREDRHDSARARNLWEYALAMLPKKQGAQLSHFLPSQILNELVRVEYEAKNYARTLQVLGVLLNVSYNQSAIQRRIDEVKLEQAAAQDGR